MIVFADAAFEHVLLMSSCVFTSQVSYYYADCCHSLVDSTTLLNYE